MELQREKKLSNKLQEYDPILMLEFFDSINPDGYIAGSGIMHEEKTAVKLTTGDYVKIKATDKNGQVLFMSSKAFFEPVVWGGPIVMNTKEELNKAFVGSMRKDSYNRQLYIKKAIKTKYLSRFFYAKKESHKVG